MTFQELQNEIVWFTIDEMERASKVEKTIRKLEQGARQLQRFMNEISDYNDQ